MTYDKRLLSLNAAQKEAVTTIDGPVMVVAGPGTGKTELLSMRVANILRSTDTLPSNILCLTFTDNGANAMRDRLFDIIGQDAYSVAIHTFHSFGSEIINHYGEYFYNGAHFRPADDLDTYQILTDILDNLDYDNPLTSKMNGVYTQLKAIKSAIAELKRSGLTSDELLGILDSNDQDLDAIEPILADIFPARGVPKSLLDTLDGCLDNVSMSPSPHTGVPSIGEVLRKSLQRAVDQAKNDNSTKPITAWRKLWMVKNANDVFEFKDRARHKKLRAVSFVYYQYLTKMQEQELFDYDDMILRVVHAMEVFPELRLNLQERFMYVMVDEFQDTNLAQSRILHNLLDHPANEGKPNIMIVGDDDQAIYSFQGADISNILEFRTTYPAAKIISLTDNYRSIAPILAASREVIIQGENRLENYTDGLSKQLQAHVTAAATSHQPRLVELATPTAEYQWVVDDIRDRLKKGESPSAITVLARRHSDIEAIIPYFHDAGLLINYERRDNILDIDIIQLIETVAHTVIALQKNDHALADSFLPKIISHPAFGFAAVDIWKLSLKAKQNRRSWLEQMLLSEPFIALAEWLIQLQKRSQTEGVERLLDAITGTPHQPLSGETTQDEASDLDPTEASPERSYGSPIFSYYFGDIASPEQNEQYLRYLRALITLRTRLRDFKPNQSLTLADFLEFLSLHRQLDSTITSVLDSEPITDSVTIMTAHGSKGLEFESVYVIGATDKAWGTSASSGGNTKLHYPENIPLAKSGGSLDERMRLFYVAMTRAKQSLTISYAATTASAKVTLPASFISQSTALSSETPERADTKELIKEAELAWYAPVVAVPHATMQQLLAPQLQKYKLSPTHLNNFIDVTNGGPQSFLLQNLLRFPEAMTPSAAYGSAIHATLQRAHAHLNATGERRPVEDCLHDFEEQLSQADLTPADLSTYLKKGSDSLTAFFAARYDSFHPAQKAELDFSHEQSHVNDAHLTGKLDLVAIDTTNKTILVTDYKTGTSVAHWKGSTPYEKIKLHKFKQQLMFYKLLIEQSRSYSHYNVPSGVIQFVEPDKTGQIRHLELSVSDEEVAQFKQLIEAVWRHIMDFSFPSTDDYAQDIKGILDFEQDLRNGVI